jgi:hypothetical protein
VATAAEGTGERVGGEGRPGREGGHRGEMTVLGWVRTSPRLVSPDLIFFSGLCSPSSDAFSSKRVTANPLLTRDASNSLFVTCFFFSDSGRLLLSGALHLSASLISYW